MTERAADRSTDDPLDVESAEAAEEVECAKRLRVMIVDYCSLSPLRALKVICSLAVDAIGQGETREDRRRARDVFVEVLDSVLAGAEERGFEEWNRIGEMSVGGVSHRGDRPS